MTCMKQEFCIHEKYCQRHIGQNFDSCILFSRNSKPMTNEEYIKSLDTEQLAERIISLCVTYFDRTDLSIVGAVKESIKINDHYDGHIQKDLLVEWLKQPHTFE